MSVIPSSSALSISTKANKSLSDAAPLVGTDTVPVQVPEVLAQPSGSFTTPVPIPEKGQVMELMPPPLDRKEIVLGLPAPSARSAAQRSQKEWRRNRDRQEEEMFQRCGRRAFGAFAAISCQGSFLKNKFSCRILCSSIILTLISFAVHNVDQRDDQRL
ncbi:hypothetical protein YC2023_099054 [Brassica napus]